MVGERMKEYEAGERHRIRTWLQTAVRRFKPRMKVIYICSVIIAIVLAVYTLWTMRQVLKAQSLVDKTSGTYLECQLAVDELQQSSDFLTQEAREFVNTGELVHLDRYIEELTVLDHRGRALSTLRDQASSEEAVAALEAARARSDALAKVELRALRLNADALGMGKAHDILATVELSSEEVALSPEDKHRQAYQLLNGNEYAEGKISIREQVQACSELLVGSLRQESEKNNEQLSMMLGMMGLDILLLLLVLVFVIADSGFLLLLPMRMYEQNIRDDQPLEPAGASELRYLVDAYNEMYAKNAVRTESLSYEARNDALTGALNRTAFNELLTQHKEGSALLLIDVDNFKQFNDEYGHDMGDAILIEVVATLYDSFRSSDYVCRIGGDEFAVIMTNVKPRLRPEIGAKVEKIANFLRSTENGLPAATISVGIAFGMSGCSDEGLFQEADRALYSVKKQGRDGYAFAELT